MAVGRLKQPELFWEKMETLKTLTGKIPASAARSLKKMMPDAKLKFRRRASRIAGLGSLGRCALSHWRIGTEAAWLREAKELIYVSMVLGASGQDQNQNLLSGDPHPCATLSRSVRETVWALDAKRAG